MKVARLTVLAGLVCVLGCNVNRISDTPKASTTSAASTPLVPEAPKSYWEVGTGTNAVTGEATKTAHLMYQDKQNIIIRQRGKKLECYVNTGDFLETTENLNTRASMVQYKFDNGKVIRQTWTISDDNNALFYPGNPQQFLDQMRHASTFAFEYHPADKIPQTITFDVAGLPDVFGK